ncbi:hypothetical protein Hanom_Chr07g00580811 [Helianthus anomalus]
MLMKCRWINGVLLGVVVVVEGEAQPIAHGGSEIWLQVYVKETETETKTNEGIEFEFDFDFFLSLYLLLFSRLSFHPFNFFRMSDTHTHLNLYRQLFFLLLFLVK